MAGRLKKKAAEVGEEGLVLGITGGFHTPALAEYLREQTKLKEWKEQAKKGEEGIYLMPYSMEETDAWGRLCQRYAFSRLLPENMGKTGRK